MHNCADVGTWFNDKKILADARDMWCQMSNETQKFYSEDYFEFKVRSLPEYINAGKVSTVYSNEQIIKTNVAHLFHKEHGLQTGQSSFLFT